MEERRVFLGWDRPFLPKAVEWLIERRDELSQMWVVVPTAQSGRRLRETLAEAAGAVLAPKVLTPGWFLHDRGAGGAPEWAERVAWIEALESVRDWSPYAALFPQPPVADGSGWAMELAGEMVRLRRSLQDNGLTLAMAADRLRETVEGERWQALARMETEVETTLAAWGWRSRSRILTGPPPRVDPGVHLVLAGVPDFPPVVERWWQEWPGRVSVLIGAPEEERESFSPLGRPLESWAERYLAWPERGTVAVAADPRQQAAEALRAVAAAGTASNDVALGAADGEVGDELARAFTRSGWPAFHPAAAVGTTGLARWLAVWSEWLVKPDLATMADLLTLPETGPLVGGRRAQKAESLARLRDRTMAASPDDLRRVAEEGTEIFEAAESLEKWRVGALRPNPEEHLRALLSAVARTGEATEIAAEECFAWLDEAAPVMAATRRSARFWIDLMAGVVTPPRPEPPAGRAIDIQGWLELFHEPGHHLVLCGMNEGQVPARAGGEPWLAEPARRALGLVTAAQRAARDAFLFHALLESRRADGRVDLFCGKTGAGGEAMLPSRLLLAAKGSDLAERVRILFREVEPPEAGLRRETDWKWRPSRVAPRETLRATAFRDYLACPFRYYLKHVLRMSAGAPDRHEWDARDFGNVAHEVVERWGRDEEARESENAVAIHAWVSRELDRVVAERFGEKLPVAVAIQVESLRQRLEWFARVQAEETAAGWRVVAVEREVELVVAGVTVRAKIDRIDRHRDGRLRVLDYKTGKVKAVDQEHRRQIRATTAIPAHLSGEACPALFQRPGKKDEEVSYLWQNLQLPLYAQALRQEGEEVPVPAYFTLADTEDKVKVHEWRGFSGEDLDCTLACATWVAERIAAGEFWPPAERVPYDDFAVLAPDGRLEEAFEAPEAWSGNPEGGTE